MDRLDPDDILHYALQTESVKCVQCGRINSHSSMHIVWKSGRGTDSRRLGASESVYANIPIKRGVSNISTRACAECLPSLRLESWTPRPAASVNIKAQVVNSKRDLAYAKSNHSAPPGFEAPGKPPVSPSASTKKPPAEKRSLQDILAEALRK